MKALYPVTITFACFKEHPVRHTVVRIPGDGIGPEVTAAGCRILEAALEGTGSSIDWLDRQAGVSAIDAGHSDLLPDETLHSIVECGVALKGPCTTPIGGGFSSVNVALRKRLQLFGAVRPVRSINGVSTRYSDVDLVVVRENTEGLYSGIENEIAEGVVTSLKVATEKATRRIAHFAFDYCRSRGRKKVTVLHKANIMKMSDGLFIGCTRDVWEKEYSSYYSVRIFLHLQLCGIKVTVILNITSYEFRKKSFPLTILIYSYSFLLLFHMYLQIVLIQELS